MAIPQPRLMRSTDSASMLALAAGTLTGGARRPRRDPVRGRQRLRGLHPPHRDLRRRARASRLRRQLPDHRRLPRNGPLPASGAQSRAGALLSYDWSRVRRVADIGGGNGAALSVLLSSHPHLHGVLFDQPNVVDTADASLRAAGVRDRCDIVGGDFFADELPSADVYVLSQILHEWNDERAGAILHNCRRSFTASRRLILVEAILPDGGEPHFARLLDLHMLVLLGGKERTETQWRTLLARARFQLREITPHGLVEAQPC